MGRKKNTVIKKLIDAGTMDSLESGIQSLRALADGLKNLRKEVVNPLRINIKAKVIVPMMQELRQYPGKPHHPIKWKSEKQRRYVMAMLRETGQEDGYKRTYKLARGWQHEVNILEDGSLSLRVWNGAESTNPFTGEKSLYMPFVQGNIGLGQSKSSAARYEAPIQPFHQDTGWNKAQPIILKYTLIAQEETVRIFIVRMTAKVEKGK